MKPIRIGKIAYTNILPIYHFFDGQNLSIEWVDQVPTALNQGMADGSIDIAPISAFAYAENFDNYRLIPNISISSHGKVRSITLFSRKPKLKQLDGSTIALTTSSATSIHLLRIILEQFEQISPTYVPMSPRLHQMMNQADAALLIGDDALKASWQQHGYYAFDLGEEWFLRTNQGMTYAVWAVRKEIADQRASEIEELMRQFRLAKEQAIVDRKSVVHEAMRMVGGTAAFWYQYFQGLHYDLREPEIAGLKTFYQYAADHGWIDPNVDVQLLNIPMSMSTWGDRVK